MSEIRTNRSVFQNHSKTSTVHTARFLQSPPDPAILHEHGQPRPAKLSPHLGDSQVAVAGEKHGGLPLVG